MGTLLTFVGFSAAAVGLLWWAGRAASNPSAKVYSANTGTSSGCAGCMVPLLLMWGLGAASAAYRLALDVEPAVWGVAATLVLGPFAAAAVLWRIEWRGVGAILESAEAQLREGFAPEQVRPARGSAAARVLVDVLSIDAAAAVPVPVAGGYRAPAERARSRPPPSPREVVRTRRRHAGIAAAVGALSTASGVFLLLGWADAVHLEADASSALAVGAAAAIPAALGWLWILRQTGQAARGAVALLGRNLDVTSESSETEATVESDTPSRPAPVSVDALGDLTRGHASVAVGDGERRRVRDDRAWGWDRAEEMVWPTGAEASSTYGAGFTPTAILGPPQVYPRCGDLPGAWAPAPQRSPAEWIEARFPDAAPAARAILVFETSAAGATFVVTTREDGDAEEQVVFARPPQTGLIGARILEIPLDPPREVERVRVHVSNATDEWAEIDTVGLVATGPVPARLRKITARATRWRRLAIFAIVIAAVIGAWLLWTET